MTEHDRDSAHDPVQATRQTLLDGVGAEVVASSPQELLAHMQKEIATYRRLVQAAGIKADEK